MASIWGSCSATCPTRKLSVLPLPLPEICQFCLGFCIAAIGKVTTNPVERREMGLFGVVFKLGGGSK